MKKDYSLPQLEAEIDELLFKAEEYFHSNPIVRDILYKYQQLTFLWHISGNLKNNSSGLPDQELKEFLRSYETTFKLPIKERLIEYYRIKFNPDMTFEGNLLDRLGLRPCAACMK